MHKEYLKYLEGIFDLQTNVRKHVKNPVAKASARQVLCIK